MTSSEAVTGERKIVDWAVNIVAMHDRNILNDSSVLRDLAKIQHAGRDPWIEVEGANGPSPRYFLRAKEFAAINDADHFYAVGQALVHKVSGSMALLGYKDTVHANAFFKLYNDGTKSGVGNLAAEIGGHGSLTAILDTSDSDVTFIETALHHAAQSGAAADMLAFLSKQPSWPDLYKAWEELVLFHQERNPNAGIRRSSDSWRELGAASKEDISRFTQTVNHYRHANNPLPDRPMSLSAARDFLCTLIRNAMR
jgi:hypothetical protein